jgi:hypothetical protein
VGDGYGLPLDLGVFEGRVQPRAKRLLPVEILLVECRSRRGEATGGECDARMVKAMWRESGSCVRSQELVGARVGHGYRIAQFAVLQDIFE